MSKPPSIDPFADAVLQALATRRESSELVLGGYLALQHYVDYRKTHDIDAWWRGRASPVTERAILETMRRIADKEGFDVREKRFGETYSVELVRAEKKAFSFQIAVRSVELEPPLASAWPPILIESRADTVGSKMNALVDRGSPRDFVDIKMIVEKNLATVEDCWNLWQQKNSGEIIQSASQKVEHHLAALEARRPLSMISNVAERSRAQAVRSWFRSEFLRV